MIDLVAAASRAVVEQLVESYGPEVPLEVETTLAKRRDGGRPEQYVDPVSLGGLVVSIATLAWTIYSDRRKEKQQPDVEELSRAVRERISAGGPGDAALRERITAIVIAEIMQNAGDEDNKRAE
jgi:hypothetical protein